jgi:hypothetical protein
MKLGYVDGSIERPGPDSDGDRGNNCYWGPVGPRKALEKAAAQERARRAKLSEGTCRLYLRRRKERKKNQKKGHLVAPRGPKRGPTRPRGAQGGHGGQKKVKSET